jgi:hypothetical protein
MEMRALVRARAAFVDMADLRTCSVTSRFGYQDHNDLHLSSLSHIGIHVEACVAF